MRKLGLSALVVGVPLALITMVLSVDVPTASAAPAKRGSAEPAAEKVDQRNLGSHIAPFILPDSAGKQISLADYSKSKFVVVLFMGTECPIGNMYVPELNELSKTYAGKGVQFLGINANPGDDNAEVAAHVKEFGVEFPVLVDSEQNVLRMFDAERTPEAFILDSQRAVRYRGRIDDRFGYVYKRPASRVQDLQQALDELLAGREVTTPVTDAVGCLITVKSRAAQNANITYAKDISRLIQARCQECHRPGMAAPFELMTYDDVTNWSEMIKEVVVQRRMPPWHADPRYGHFSNDMRMPQEEIDTLVAWIENGMPLGDEKELPEPRQYAEGWQIGEPDLVVKMPEEYTVQAEGEVEYQYFVTKTSFDKDMWIKASEARPGNRAAVHHIIVFARDPEKVKQREQQKKQRQGGQARRRGGNNQRQREQQAGEDENELGDWVGTYAPGTPASVLPDGIGRKLPAGSELVWQLHYTPTGKVEKDQSEVGFVFCEEPPKYEVKAAPLMNTRFKIPPGADNYEVKADFEVPKDARILSFLPHMHLRGKDFMYQAKYPDGRTEILLSVPNYDFNWQHIYRLNEPALLPAGTKIECVAHYDNSAENPNNPDPTVEVGWGDQTWEEMMLGYMDITWAQPGDVAEETPKKERR